MILCLAYNNQLNMANQVVWVSDSPINLPSHVTRNLHHLDLHCIALRERTHAQETLITNLPYSLLDQDTRSGDPTNALIMTSPQTFNHSPHQTYT